MRPLLLSIAISFACTVPVAAQEVMPVLPPPDMASPGVATVGNPAGPSVAPVLFQSWSDVPFHQLAVVPASHVPPPPSEVPPVMAPSHVKVTAPAWPRPIAVIADTARTRQKLEMDPASAFAPRLDAAASRFRFIFVSLWMGFLFIDYSLFLTLPRDAWQPHTCRC